MHLNNVMVSNVLTVNNNTVYFVHKVRWAKKKNHGVTLQTGLSYSFTVHVVVKIGPTLGNDVIIRFYIIFVAFSNELCRA